MVRKRHKDEFGPEFEEYLLELIVKVVEQQMADITKLQADVDAQKPLIDAVNAKLVRQDARIAELEAQIANIPPSDPQAPIDGLAATVEANNAALADAGK